MEEDLWWKKTLIKDNLWWKMAVDWRRPLIEDDHWWKATSVEDDLQWKRTSDGRWKTTFDIIPMEYGLQDDLQWKMNLDWRQTLMDTIQQQQQQQDLGLKVFSLEKTSVLILFLKVVGFFFLHIFPTLTLTPCIPSH